MDGGYKKIMLVTDGMQSAAAAEETALNLARRHGANVLVVDTVKPPSLASQWLTSNAQDVFEMVVEDKQTRLQKIASRFTEHGLTAEVEVLCGKSSEEIAREAAVNNVDLVIRYLKGEHSRRAGFFGTTALNLMRVCHCPLLLVRDKSFDQPKVMACINAEHDFKENEGILSETRRLAGNDANTLALYCWKFYGSEIMREYMDDETFKQCINEAEQNYRGLYEKFLQNHDMSSFDNRVHLENGDPIEVIPQISKHEAIDVVVMSSASRNHPVRRLLGSTIEAVLDHIPCSLLVVKPVGFKSPIQPTRSTVEIVN